MHSSNAISEQFVPRQVMVLLMTVFWDEKGSPSSVSQNCVGLQRTTTWTLLPNIFGVDVFSVVTHGRRYTHR